MTRYAIIYGDGSTDRIEADDFVSVCGQLSGDVVAIVNDCKVMVHRGNTPFEENMIRQADLRVASEQLIDALAESTVKHSRIEESLARLGELDRRLSEEGE